MGQKQEFEVKISESDGGKIEYIVEVKTDEMTFSEIEREYKILSKIFGGINMTMCPFCDTVYDESEETNCPNCYNENNCGCDLTDYDVDG